MYLVNTLGRPADDSFLCPAFWAMVTRNPATKRMFLSRELFLRADCWRVERCQDPCLLKDNR